MDPAGPNLSAYGAYNRMFAYWLNQVMDPNRSR